MGGRGSSHLLRGARVKRRGGEGRERERKRERERERERVKRRRCNRRGRVTDLLGEYTQRMAYVTWHLTVTLYSEHRNSTGVLSSGRSSSKCWSNRPILSLRCSDTSPLVGVSWPGVHARCRGIHAQWEEFGTVKSRKNGQLKSRYLIDRAIGRECAWFAHEEHVQGGTHC